MLQIIAGDHAAFSNLYWPNYCDHFLLQTFSQKSLPVFIIINTGMYKRKVPDKLYKKMIPEIQD